MMCDNKEEVEEKIKTIFAEEMDKVRTSELYGLVFADVTIATPVFTALSVLAAEISKKFASGKITGASPIDLFIMCSSLMTACAAAQATALLRCRAEIFKEEDEASKFFFGVN